MLHGDKYLLKKLKNGDEKAFEILFKKYNRKLVIYAIRFVGSQTIAEDIVQDIFMKLWKMQFDFDPSPSIQAYLFQSVRNHCLNYIKHQKIENTYGNIVRSELLEKELNCYNSPGHPTNSIFQQELEEVIEKAINSLPDHCKNIFELSRYHHLKNKEIAMKMNVTIKAVEKQITKALKIIRESIKTYFAE